MRDDTLLNRPVMVIENTRVETVILDPTDMEHKRVQRYEEV